MTLLLGLLYLVEKNFFLLVSFGSSRMLLLLGAAIIITGVLINIISAYFSVNRYLRISEDKLYY
jgi:cell division transport system permease protein